MAFIFLDTETSGLDPYKHDITEIGAVYIRDDYSVDLKSTFHKRLLLQNPDNADEEALEVGHYSESQWEKTGVHAEEGLLDFNKYLQEVCPSEKPTIVAQNAEFDKSMWYSNADRYQVTPFASNTWIDLISLWIIYKVKNGYTHLTDSQGVISKHLGIENPKAHAALADAATGAKCFEKMMKGLYFKM